MAQGISGLLSEMHLGSNERSSLSELPREVCIYILNLLDIADIIRMAQTSRHWHELTNDRAVWKEHCLRDFRMKLNPDILKHPFCWKTEYRKNYLLHKNWQSGVLPKSEVFEGHFHEDFEYFHGDYICVRSTYLGLKVYNSRTGVLMHELRGHEKAIISSCMNDSIIVTGSADKMIRIWNIETGQCKFVLKGHARPVSCLDMQNNRLVSGSRDGVIRMWDTQTGQCLQVFEQYYGRIEKIRIHDDTIVSSVRHLNNEHVIWKIDDPIALSSFDDRKGPSQYLHFDGTFATVVYHRQVIVTNVWDLRKVMSLSINNSHCLGRTDDLIVTGHQCAVEIHKYPTGELLHILVEKNHRATVLCLDVNSFYIVSSHTDKTFRLWNVRTGDLLALMVSPVTNVRLLKIDENKILLSYGPEQDYIFTNILVYDFRGRNPHPHVKRRRTVSC